MNKKNLRPGRFVFSDVARILLFPLRSRSIREGYAGHGSRTGSCVSEGTGIAPALAVVIPAEAGIHLLGIRHTSRLLDSCLRRNDRVETRAPASPKGLGSRPPLRLSFPRKRESSFLGHVTPHGSWIPACAGMTESKREFLRLRGDRDRGRPCGCHSRGSGNPSSRDTSHLTAPGFLPAQE